MQDHQVVGAERLNRAVDLLERGHAGREDDRLAGRGQGLEHPDVGDGRGGDPVRCQFEILEEVDGGLVPGVSRGVFFMCSGVESAGVCFWNLTARAPSSTSEVPMWTAMNAPIMGRQTDGVRSWEQRGAR